MKFVKIVYYFILFFITVLVFLLLFSFYNYRKPSINDLPGEYIVNYEFGKEKLILYKDGTYKQIIKVYPGNYKTSGKINIYIGIRYITLYKEDNVFNEEDNIFVIKKINPLINKGKWSLSDYDNLLRLNNYISVSDTSGNYVYAVDFPNIEPLNSGYISSKKYNGKIKLYFHPDLEFAFEKIKNY